MGDDLIKSFLVGLGFGVDEASLNKFNKAITGATLKANALYGAISLTAEGIKNSLFGISEGFEEIGYEYKLIAPAINKALILRQEMLKAYSAAGVNLNRVVQSALRLNLSLTKTRYAFEALYKSVASRFFETIANQSDIFRKKLYDNLPAIQEGLEKLVSVLFSAFSLVITLGKSIWDVFVALDKATSGWSTAILLAVEAWKLLNLGFFLTPFGSLIAGFTALLALWTDLQAFKSGGEYLIDWGNQAIQVFTGLTAVVTAAAIAYGGWAIATGTLTVATGVFSTALTFLGGILGTLLVPFSLFILLAASAAVIISKLYELATGKNLLQSLGASILGLPSVSPIGSGAQGSSSQSINQQTQVNIQGVADAQKASEYVTSSLAGIDRDWIRDLKGATTPGTGNGFP